MPCWLRTRLRWLTFQRLASDPWNSSLTLAFPQRNTLAALVGWLCEAEAVGTEPASGARTTRAATGAAMRAIRENGMRTTVEQVAARRTPGRRRSPVTRTSKRWSSAGEVLPGRSAREPPAGCGYCGAQPSWSRCAGGGRTRNVRGVILVVTDDEVRAMAEQPTILGAHGARGLAPSPTL